MTEVNSKRLPFISHLVVAIDLKNFAQFRGWGGETKAFCDNSVLNYVSLQWWLCLHWSWPNIQSPFSQRSETRLSPSGQRPGLVSIQHKPNNKFHVSWWNDLLFHLAHLAPFMVFFFHFCPPDWTALWESRGCFFQVRSLTLSVVTPYIRTSSWEIHIYCCRS